MRPTIIGDSEVSSLLNHGGSAENYIDRVFAKDINVHMASVTPNHNGASGLVGGFAVVTNSYVTGVLTNARAYSGVINGKSVTNSYIDVNIVAGDSIAGAISAEPPSGTDTYQNIFSLGSIRVTGNQVGALLGRNSYWHATLNLNNLYWYDWPGDSATTCRGDGGDESSCTMIDAQSGGREYFYDASNPPMNAWDFTTIWQENPGALPTLRGFE